MLAGAEAVTLATRVLSAFEQAFGHNPDGVIRAPGRVNLIGEHTDYNGGFVLPCAIDVETRIAWARRADRNVRVVACEFGNDTDFFSLGDPIPHHPLGGWRNYVRGMVETMRYATSPTSGVDMAIGGNIPRGAGLSSSASLEVAVGMVLASANRCPLPAVEMAQLAQAAENNFVGMKCGIMDQLASAAGVEGAALVIDCRDLTFRSVTVPDDVVIAIMHSGVDRGLVDGHYNRRRIECEEAAAALGVDSLRAADVAMLESTPMSEDARARARHIFSENVRVLAAAAAFEAGDLHTLGKLMVESHASMRDDFKITVPKIDELADIANEEIGGVGGARMTGGGFGGAVVAVMSKKCAPKITAAIGKRYQSPAGKLPSITIHRAVAGAGSIAPGDWEVDTKIEMVAHY